MQAFSINPEKNFPLEIVLKSQEIRDFQTGIAGRFPDSPLTPAGTLPG